MRALFILALVYVAPSCKSLSFKKESRKEAKGLESSSARSLSGVGSLFKFGKRVAGGLRPAVGGGFVADSARVVDDAFVGPNARVLDDVVIRDNARIEDNALIENNALIRDNAVVKDNTRVGGNAVLEGNTRVGDNARVGGNARIRDALVTGNSNINRGEYFGGILNNIEN